MAVGLIVKSTPLALVPILVPPDATVNHSIVLPAEVAVILDGYPKQMAAGVTDTDVAIEGTGLTVTLNVFVVITSLSPVL